MHIDQKHELITSEPDTAHWPELIIRLSEAKSPPEAGGET